jgi:hypothetical protein
MMRATKVVLAPSRSANIDTLLAEGKAAAMVKVIKPARGNSTPKAIKPEPTPHTSAGCKASLQTAGAHTGKAPTRASSGDV